MPIKLSVTDALKLIAVLLVGVGVFLGVRQVLEWRDAAAQNEVRGKVLETTSGILSDSQQLDSETAGVEAGVAQAKGRSESQYAEAKRHDPSFADYADSPVPDRVLEIARERRQARERLGCAAGWGRSECEAQAPPER